jgi:hypothetical protein
MIKLVTRFELASRSTGELHVTYRAVFNALVKARPGSAERRTCLASLENIQAEIRSRVPAP